MSDETDRANERGRKVIHGLMTVEQANAEAAAEAVSTKQKPKRPARED